MSVTVFDGSISNTISVIVSIIDVADTTISTVSLGVSDRTPEVRDAIVAAVPIVTDAANVTTAHLTAITVLDLRNKGITTLKAGDFSGLTGLTSLNLYGNMLSSLPNGIFSGLTALTSLRVGGNTFDPIPIIVSLEQVSSNQYRVVIPTGAPFDVAVPILLSDGSDHPEGLGTVTVSKGSVKSAVRTVPIVRGTFIDIGALPSLPANHFGYILSKSATCNVTQQVAEVIAAAVPGVEDCRNVSQAQLAAITSLNLSNKSITSLQNNDFTDLLSLTTLNLENNLLSSLPDGIFAGMTSLNTLQLSGNTGAPFSFEVSLEKVGTNQFKAVLPVGAPFDIAVPISVTNGSAANSITISQGSVESEALLVTRTLLTTEAVSVDIGTLPSIPATHNGYTLSKSIDLPLEIFSAINAVPVFTEGPTATRSIAENTAAETNIGSPVSATDANSSDRLVYTLSGTDAASFAIVASNGQLQTKNALDHETKDSYTVTITVSDGNQSDTINVTINVSDVVENKAPVFTDGANATRTIAENTPLGTNIGSPVAATDADSDTLIYALDGTNANVFSIASSTGQLQTKLALNFERKRNYKVTVTATDGKGGSDSITVTINITNVVNEDTQQQTREELVTNNPPVFTEGTTAARSIDENTVAGTNIGTPVAATDANILDILAYTLSGADAASFDIVGTTGQLQTKAALDFETTTSYSVTVTVSDGNNGTDTINVTINVIDVNENVAPMFTEGATATRTIAENTVAGTNIGSPIGATDANVGDTLIYTLSGTDAASFAIVDSTGQLQTKAALDFETTTSYSVMITVSDGKNGTDTINVTINVTNVVEGGPNNAPVFTEGVATTRSIAENTASGTNIGSVVTATDTDMSDTLSYTLGGVDAHSFTIVGTSGQLQTSAALNYEDKNTYTVTATASDNKGGTDSIDVTINVTDVNDPPRFVDGTSATITIPENTGNSPVPIGDFNVIDEDGEQLRYSYLGPDWNTFRYGYDEGFHVEDDLSITWTGRGYVRIYVKSDSDLDFEAKTSYSLTLAVRDTQGATGQISVTINLTDVVNEAPPPPPNRIPYFFGSTSTAREIAENAGPGENIGRPLDIRDLDNDPLTFTLGGTDAASFDITNWGQLRTKPVLEVLPFDYETKSSYSISATASDGRGGTDTISITVNITDEPEAPEFTDGDSTTRTISENSAADTNIGSAVSATDPDADDTVTYTLGGTNAAAFTVDNGTGQLKTKAALDFETTTSYTVTLTATDKDDLTDSITVTINVGDLNEVPSNNVPIFTEGATTTRSIAENTAKDTNIGTAVTATDTDPGSTLSYQLSGADGAAFSIDESTGQLKTDAALNYETKDAYSVTITVTDGTLTDTITVTINVTDANDAPVFSDGTSTTRNASKNTGANTNIGTSVIATDEDGDTLTYTLSGTDAASFDIVSTSGQMKTKAALNFETKASYEVTVTVSDGKGGTDSIAVTINVNDINENTGGPAFTERPSTTRSIPENTPANVNIGEPLTATDIDNDILDYYFFGLIDSIYFSIDSSTGQLKTKASLNHEQKSSHTLQVTVTDGQYFGHIVVDINVTDVNEVTAFAEGESTTRSVAENTSAGVNIGSPVKATDQDRDALTYTLTGADAASFDIVDTTGQLQVKTALDFETTTSYTITITASDGRGGTDSITVTINVTDVAAEANNPPEFTDGASTTRSVAENTAANENIGSAVAATDVDHDILTYSLSGADAASFDIIDTTGQLRTNAALDFETRSSYNVTITVSDSIIGGTDTITVTIRVTDLEPENTPPVFTDGASTTRTIDEHAEEDWNYWVSHPTPDLIIGTPIAATDTDGDTLTYKIEDSRHSYTLKINSSSGQLATHNWVDYEITSRYLVTITVSDGNGGTDSIDVTVNITDVNEQPFFGTVPYQSYSGSTTIRHAIHGAAANTNIGNPITVSDVDANSTLTYSLSGTDAASFTIGNTTGQLTNNSALDVDTKASYSVVVTASDGNLSASINVTVNVIKVADPAVESRSAAVRTAIVNAISDVDSPNDVTTTHLTNITRLDLSNKSIASLSAGDFNDLFALEFLDLSDNNLTSLPADIFDHLTRLDILLLDDNEISSLDGDIFENNTNLVRLDLHDNYLYSLPDGIFEGLSSLTGLRLFTYDDEFPAININLVAVDDEDGNSQTAKYKVTVHTGSVEDLDVEVWSVQSSDGNLTFDRKHQTVRVSTGSVESSEITIERSEFSSNNSAIYLAVRQNELPNQRFLTVIRGLWFGGFYYSANQTPLLMLPANEAGAPFADGRESVPVSTELLPNFPNPFNPETWIPYQLAKPSHVSITIYDIRGNVVRRLDLGQQKTGYYTDRSRAAHWDGRNNVGEHVANGIYFYKFEADGVSALRKMLIVK